MVLIPATFVGIDLIFASKKVSKLKKRVLFFSTYFRKREIKGNCNFRLKRESVTLYASDWMFPLSLESYPYFVNSFDD